MKKLTDFVANKKYTISVIIIGLCYIFSTIDVVTTIMNGGFEEVFKLTRTLSTLEYVVFGTGAVLIEGCIIVMVVCVIYIGLQLVREIGGDMWVNIKSEWE